MTTPPPSAARPQLEAIVRFFHRILPKWAFPAVPFAMAATFQVFAWFGGRFLSPLTLVPRVLVLWLFALGEYAIMSPVMNAAQEVLGTSENVLVVMYILTTLVVYLFASLLVFRKRLRWQHGVAFLLVAVAAKLVYV